MPSKCLQTAQKYISQFGTLDTSYLSTLLASDYHHTFAPSSIPSLPGPFNKSAFLTHHSHLGDVMTSFPVTGKEYIVNEAGNQVTVWATSEACFREDVMGGGEVEKWKYKGEYVFMLWMDESWEKVVRVVEVLDSKGTADVLMPLMRRARENRAIMLKDESREEQYVTK
jgi:hypothetical protein